MRFEIPEPPCLRCESFYPGGAAKVQTPVKENTCAVIVTYHPPESLPDLVAAVAGQVDCVIIVDNTPATAPDWLRRLSARPRLHLILNGENLGVASALNLGVSCALAAGYRWALTLDQDSVPGDSLLAVLGRAYDQCGLGGRVAVIGVNYEECPTGRLAAAAPPAGRVAWVERECVITSGSLVSLTALETIGPFRDEFFIDAVDFEYCLRARAKGFKVILACEPALRHTVGVISPHRLLWRRVWVSNHSPARWYYMTRNQTVLTREYLLREYPWLIRISYYFLKRCLKMCCFEDQRPAKLRAVARGLRHGIRLNFQQP